SLLQQTLKRINEEHTISPRAKNAMIDSLCNMFMRSASNLKYLILSPYVNVNDKDIPKSRIFIDNEPGLANLRKLKLRFFANLLDQHERRENLYDLLKLLPNVCNGLVHLDVNRIKVPNCMIAEILTGLIKSQPELTYCRFYKVYGDMTKLIDALPVHKLMSLVLDDLSISGFSLASLSRSTRLESLVFRKC
ncbi:3776_t:CDS:1, partial [Funneliformis mosseae]